jgi:hypothetical protein
MNAGIDPRASKLVEDLDGFGCASVRIQRQTDMFKNAVLGWWTSWRGIRFYMKLLSSAFNMSFDATAATGREAGTRKRTAMDTARRKKKGTCGRGKKQPSHKLTVKS